MAFLGQSCFKYCTRDGQCIYMRVNMGKMTILSGDEVYPFSVDEETWLPIDETRIGQTLGQQQGRGFKLFRDNVTIHVTCLGGRTFSVIAISDNQEMSYCDFTRSFFDGKDPWCGRKGVPTKSARNVV